ncbi:hypothetical protein BHE74_00034910 [Ensete ventricosum]|nr:hypothetical protein BHE74_00034910 [Ensete ventricosum]
MLRPGVTREWVGEGELPKERMQSEVMEALRCADRGHTWRDRSPSSSHRNLNAIEMSPGGHMVQRIVVLKQVVERGEEVTSPEGLSYLKAKRRLERRWIRRSTTVPLRRIYRSRRKGRRCKATDSRTMGLAALWYRIDRTSVESSIPCSHGGRALVVKGVERWRMQRQTPITKTRRKDRGQETSKDRCRWASYQDSRN